MAKNKIYSLIAELKEEVDQSPNAFMSKKKNIDTETVLEIIEDIIKYMPEEIEHAQRILDEKEQIIGSANAQADQIVSQARQRAEELIDENTITTTAIEKAEKIVEDANANAQDLLNKSKMRSDALYNMTSSYALEVMSEMETYFTEYLDLLHENKTRISSKLDNRPSE